MESFVSLDNRNFPIVAYFGIDNRQILLLFLLGFSSEKSSFQIDDFWRPPTFLALAMQISRQPLLKVTAHTTRPSQTTHHYPCFHTSATTVGEVKTFGVRYNTGIIQV
jgi:hypothetical protein